MGQEGIKDKAVWLAGTPKEVQDLWYVDKVCQRCGETSYGWWYCPNELVLPKTLTISCAKRRREEDSGEDTALCKRLRSPSQVPNPVLARITAILLATRITFPVQEQDRYIITDSEESDFDIDGQTEFPAEQCYSLSNIVVSTSSYIPS